MSFRDHVARAVQIMGSQQKLAEAIGCSQQQISYLLNEAERISAEMAVAIERATGIPRHELRPDLYPPPSKRAREPEQARS